MTRVFTPAITTAVSSEMVNFPSTRDQPECNLTRDHQSATARLSQPSRNARCTCGSQKRFKDCCGQATSWDEARSDLAPSLREVPVGNYVVFYRPMSDGVVVVRILHAARTVADFEWD